MNRKHALLGMVACAMLFLSLQVSGPAEPAAPGTGYTLPVASTTGMAEDFESYDDCVAFNEGDDVRDGDGWNAWAPVQNCDFTLATRNGHAWARYSDTNTSATIIPLFTFSSASPVGTYPFWIETTVIRESHSGANLGYLVYEGGSIRIYGELSSVGRLHAYSQTGNGYYDGTNHVPLGIETTIRWVITSASTFKLYVNGIALTFGGNDTRGTYQNITGAITKMRGPGIYAGGATTQCELYSTDVKCSWIGAIEFPRGEQVRDGGGWDAWATAAGSDFTAIKHGSVTKGHLVRYGTSITPQFTFSTSKTFSATTDWVEITIDVSTYGTTLAASCRLRRGGTRIIQFSIYDATRIGYWDGSTWQILFTGLNIANELRIRIAYASDATFTMSLWEDGVFKGITLPKTNTDGTLWSGGAITNLYIYNSAGTRASYSNIRCSWLIEEAGPILIDGDADYPSYASSGSGTSGDPWVVDDHEIHCNDTCVAVEVSSASEHATFSNITTNGTDTFNAIEITSTGNVTMTGITISNASTGINITGCDGITIDGATIDTGSTAVTVMASTGIMLDGVFIDGGDVEFENVNDSVIRNCAFSGSLFINNSRNVTVENCTFSGLFMFAIYLDGTIDCITIVDCGFAGNFVGVSIPAGGNVTIQDCLFWMNMGGVAIDTGGNATVENCTFTANWYGVLVNTGGLGTITGCTFTANDVVLDSASTSIRVSGNFIMPGNTVLLDGNATWAGNYYRDYFDLFPGAITVNTTTNVLASEYPLNPTTNDTMPLYYPAWFPRSERFAFRFYSNVDYEGVPFEQLQLFIDGVRVTTATPLAGDLLSRVTVYDYSGRLLHDEVYNLNASGPNINIGLDVSVYVHFQFYSTLDYFGLPFELVKLYVNGTRITTPSPTMRPAVINIVVRDYADIVIYNQTIDLATTGIYIHIGLPVALTTITNQHDQEVIFMLARGTVTTTFAMARGGQLTLWLATGDYSYQVAATDGTVLEEFHEHAINANVTTRTIELAIGCGGVPPPVLPLPSLLGYCVLLAGCGALNGIVLLLAINMRRRRTP